MRRTGVLIAVLAVALAGLVGPSHASTQARGFNGHATGQATFVPTASIACVNPPLQTVSTGTGASSPMGPVSISALHCSGNHIDGSMTLTGKYGTVTLHYVGDCTPYVPGVTTRVECATPFTITGGTGRYAGATGTGHLHAVVIPQAGTTPWPATWTWKGRIRS